MTFFGGETLLNLSAAEVDGGVCEATGRAKRASSVEFSLTTNATLLTEEIVDFLAEHRIGVTVSIDGDQELNDKMRVFHDGRGSYDVIVPKIKMLLARHKTNSIGARVTLSSGVSHVRRIYRASHEAKSGFKAVGFSPATANPDRLYHIGATKMGNVFGGFEELAWEYRDYALAGKPHGFTNVNDTLKELHSGYQQGVSVRRRARPARRRHGGRYRLCHRFVDSPVGQMGHVTNGGVDHAGPQRVPRNASSSAPDTTATPAGRGRCAPAAVITRPTSTTATRPRPICTTATGSAAGTISACGSTDEISVQNPSFLNRLTKTERPTGSEAVT